MTSVTVFDFTFMKIVSTWLILNLDIVRVVVFFVTAYHMALHLIVAWLGSGMLICSILLRTAVIGFIR